MTRPIDVLLNHLETLRQAFANGTPAGQAWRRMPAVVTSAMGWPTFRVIAPIVVATMEWLAIDGSALQPVEVPPEHF